MHHNAHLSTIPPVGAFVLLACAFLVLTLYFYPTITALRRNSPNKTAVIIVNVFLGVTLIGWLVALLLAGKQPQPVVVVYNTPPPPH